MKSKLGELILCNTKDIAKEYSEMALDSFLDEGILKSIPVISSITSIFKIHFSIKNASFCKNLTTFLYNMNDIPIEKRKEFNEKALKDDKEFGEKLIYVLDSLDENKKAEYLAKLYKGYCEDILTYHEFRKCCRALTQIYMGDMTYLINEVIYESIGFTFVSLGLYESSRNGKHFGEISMNDVEYVVRTDLGNKMNQCIFN